MRMGWVLVGVIALGVPPAVAGPEETKAAIREFGLIGTWSSDCSKEASRDQPRFGYEIPLGRQAVAYSYTGTTRSVGVILEAAIVDNARIRYRFQREGDVSDVREFIIEKSAGRIRFYRVTMSDGNVVIRDGMNLGYKPPRETPLLERCRD